MISGRRQSYDLTALVKYPDKAFQAHARTTVYYWPKNGFKDRPYPGSFLELSNRTSVDCRISFLSPHLESHGFLFKILIQMHFLSTDKAI